MTTKTMQVGTRLDAWHFDRLKKINPAVPPTATANELLSLVIELASGEQPPLATALEKVKANWQRLEDA